MSPVDQAEASRGRTGETAATLAVAMTGDCPSRGADRLRSARARRRPGTGGTASSGSPGPSRSSSGRSRSRAPMRARSSNAARRTATHALRCPTRTTRRGLAPGHGFLELAPHGCGMFDLLVVNGEQRGRVWWTDSGYSPLYITVNGRAPVWFPRLVRGLARPKASIPRASFHAERAWF
jgi:hypothetical protein